MFKYLLVLQVVFVNQFYGFEVSPIENFFGGQESFANSDINLINTIQEREFDISPEGRSFEEPEQFKTLYPPPIPLPIFYMRYYSQYLNHFDRTDQRLWRQRYFIHGGSYKPGGPVFLMVGYGEYNKRLYGAWVNYAKQFGAMLIYLEHRYYGESWPTGDLSIESLKYLNSEQALGDVANFIHGMNREFGENTKWVAFGGSYGGSLATWLRLKYPHLVHGAVASSAPLRPAVEYPEYYENLGDIFGKYSQECKSGLKEALAELRTLLQTPEDLMKNFHVNWILFGDDYPLFKPLDINFLIEGLATGLANPAFTNVSLNSYISVTCDFMTNQTLGTPLNRLAAFLRMKPLPLFANGYNARIRVPSIPNWNVARHGGRQRLYQACTEYGHFRTSNDSSHLFGKSIPLSYFKQMCDDVLGPDYHWDKLIYNTDYRLPMIYGGTNLNVTNVVFVHGSVDPMHPLGIVNDVNPKAPAIIIEGATHCADMDADHVSDSPQLKEAREKIAKNIETWLKQ